MARVFVTQERMGFNYTDAEKYGEVHFVTHHEYTMPHTSDTNKFLREDIRMAVNQFNPDEDYLLLSGNPIIAGVIIGRIMKEYDPEYIRMLKWDNRRLEYGTINAFTK